MLSQRRVFAVKPLGGRDRAGEALAHGCIVPGVTSTCRRILDTEDGGTPHLPEGGGEPRTLQRQVPPPTLASWDSGVEMVAGDSSLAAFPGLSQDSLNMEPMGSPEPQALAAPEPPSQLDQLLASRKLEQVLEQSQGRAHLSTQHCALPAAPWSRPGCVLAAEAELEGGPGGSRGGSSRGAQSLGLPPWTGASLPGAPVPGAGADGKTAAAVLGASDPEPPSIPGSGRGGAGPRPITFPSTCPR